jgi:uncharacterized protein YggE
VKDVKKTGVFRMRILFQLLLAGLLGLTATTAAFADSAPTATPTITVTGSAVLAAVPDLATITLGVTTNGATASAAMAANSAAVSAVMTRLQAAGIAARDYQTSSLSLNPNWVTNAAGTGSEIKGYVAGNMLTIRVRALDQLGIVLDALIADGVNTLNSLTFGLQNTRPTEDEARKQAVTDAMARAQLIATASGSKLGRILSISEGGRAAPIPGQMFRMAADAAAVPVAQGEVEISAAITMVFELQP